MKRDFFMILKKRAHGQTQVCCITHKWGLGISEIWPYIICNGDISDEPNVPYYSPRFSTNVHTFHDPLTVYRHIEKVRKETSMLKLCLVIEHWMEIRIWEVDEKPPKWNSAARICLCRELRWCCGTCSFINFNSWQSKDYSNRVFIKLLVHRILNAVSGFSICWF